MADLWDYDVRKITRPMIINHKDATFEKPATCRISLSVLSNLFQFAYDHGWVEGNPAGAIRGLPCPKPYPRWSDDDLDIFLATAPTHLARSVRLALYTGQRRSDLIRMTWDSYSGNGVLVKQQKTGKELFIPVHPALKADLDQPERHGPFLIWNAFGQPWSAESIQQAVARHCKKIGLKDRVLHGLRKTTASKLAEAGCTIHQIMAITGHCLTEAEYYSRQANQKIMAEQAMEVWNETAHEAPYSVASG